MQQNIQLTADLSIPILGFGTWQLLGDECETALQSALDIGYRHIDTADRYDNHAVVGSTLKNSGIAREDIFLTSKLWMDNLTRGAVLNDVDRFLAELQTDYLDLLLIHWPNKDIPIAETLTAMEECKQAGKIRAIGVSNFTERHLAEAAASGVTIVNNQVEVRPQFNQNSLVEYCRKHNITVTGYSTLQGEDMALELIQELAQKYERTPAQIILNWCFSRDIITLTRSANPKHIKENFESLNFELVPEDAERINALPQGTRFNDPSFGEFGD